MTIKGVVENIIFYNSENGYTVLSVKSDNTLYTCVGNLPIFSVGESVEFSGEFVTHKSYGEQFAVKSFSTVNPKGKEATIRFLSSGLIKGVGEVLAGRIFDSFGDESIDVVESQPLRLAEVKGISQKKALEIGTACAQVRAMQRQILFLMQYGITVNTAIKIYNTYKDATSQVVAANPYKLIDDIDGIGFITADRIAQNMGIAPDSPFRVRAAIVFCLKESAEKNGNTYLPVTEIINKAQELLKLDLSESYAKLFEETLERLALDVAVKVFTDGDEKNVSLVSYYNMEKKISDSLVRLVMDAQKTDIDYNTIIDEFERVNKIKFHESQRKAVVSAVNNGVTVITGGPGTGKTTIIKCITHIFTSQRKKVELCSPTGRASKRLAEATGQDAKTIHRLLGVGFADNGVNFYYNQFNQLPAEVIIVDEVSMVDVYIMSSLLKAVANGSRLVLVGDKDQLPSVGAGNVLADIIASGVILTEELTHIYRQEEGSLIVSNAHLINKCKMPEIDNSSKDFFVINKQNGDEVLQECLGLITTRLPNWTKASSKDIQLLGAMKSGTAGVENCNRQLQQLLNPHEAGKNEIQIGETVLREGDKVMQIVNDYEMKWQKRNTLGFFDKGDGVFNGDIGYINHIDRSSGEVEIIFDDNRYCLYSRMDLFNVVLAYAITIHKSQGSEFDVVVIPLVSGPPTILNKNLLYTAVTRAKKAVVLVCNKKVLSMVVHNNYIAMRLTLLNRFLKEDYKKYGELFG